MTDQTSNQPADQAVSQAGDAKASPANAIAGKDAVKAAANAIVAAGDSPSVVKIQRHLGGGSATSVTKYLREWRLEQESKPASATPQAAEDKVDDGIDEDLIDNISDVSDVNEEIDRLTRVVVGALARVQSSERSRAERSERALKAAQEREVADLIAGHQAALKGLADTHATETAALNNQIDELAEADDANSKAIVERDGTIAALTQQLADEKSGRKADVDRLTAESADWKGKAEESDRQRAHQVAVNEGINRDINALRDKLTIAEATAALAEERAKTIADRDAAIARRDESIADLKQRLADEQVGRKAAVDDIQQRLDHAESDARATIADLKVRLEKAESAAATLPDLRVEVATVTAARDAAIREAETVRSLLDRIGQKPDDAAPQTDQPAEQEPAKPAKGRKATP